MRKVISSRNNNHRWKVSFETLICYLLVSCPILGIYNSLVPSISIGEILLVFVCILSIGAKKKSIKVNSIGSFVVYSLIITVVMSLIISPINVGETIKETTSFIIYIVAVVLILKRLNNDDLMRAYVVMAKISAAFLILQFLVHLITGVWIPGLIPGIITDSGLNSSTIILNYSRACSFFQEPAHFAQYVAFPLAYIVFLEEKSFADIIWIGIFILAILMNYTGNGILIMCVIFGLYVLFNLDTKNVRRFMKAISLMIIGVVAGRYILMNTSVGQTILLRLTSGELLGSNNTVFGNSGYIRVVRGYEVFGKFELLHKVFGVGLGNYEVYATRHAYSTLIAKTAFTISYLNGIQYYLVSTGLVGLGLYLRVLFNNFKNNNSFRRTISILFVTMSSIAAFINGPIWIIAIVIIYSRNDNSINDNKV